MAIDKLKKKFTTGAWLNDVKHYFNKINELVEQTNTNTVTISNLPAASYSVYTGIFNQSGGANPVVTVLENTIGSIVWTATGTGVFRGTLVGAFPVELKTLCCILGNANSNNIINFYWIDTNNIEISIYGDWTNPGAPMAANGAYNLPIEIRVYP